MKRALSGAVLGALIPLLTCCASGDRLEAEGLVHPRDVGGIMLPDITEHGVPMSFAAPKDGLMLVYFGYASCTRYCPTTLGDVRTALRSLRPDLRSRVEFVAATVDPAHDTADRFASFVHTYVPTARALRTDDTERLRAAADAFGASYAVDSNPDGTSAVAIDAFLYVVDEHATVLTMWPFGTPATDMVRELGLLLLGCRP